MQCEKFRPMYLLLDSSGGGMRSTKCFLLPFYLLSVLRPCLFQNEVYPSHVPGSVLRVLIAHLQCFAPCCSSVGHARKVTVHDGDC